MNFLDRLFRRMRGEVSQEEIFRAIRSIPRHFSGHRLQSDLSIAPFQFPDPALPSGNTTAGAGELNYTLDAVQVLNSINASTAEIRTLNDPVKSNLYLVLVLQQKVAQNLVVRANTPLWIGTTVTQPAITQLGQYITFSATNQVCGLFSVPTTLTSYVGTQATVTNKTGYRWVVDILDGATVT